eukprot:2095662-Alexandrium_andersonii.AAC.1
MTSKSGDFTSRFRIITVLEILNFGSTQRRIIPSRVKLGSTRSSSGRGARPNSSSMKSASHSTRCLATHSAMATCSAWSSGTPAGGDSCRLERLTRP